MTFKTTFIFLILSFLIFCFQPSNSVKVKVGLDNLNSYQELFENKQIGIITNHTAYNSNDEHIVDVFSKMENVKITALFGPEHGIRGEAEAGAKVESERDPVKNVPIYSLYGKNRKPTPKMLQNVDVLVFDIQDIGARFYTYVYTMSLAMEAAAEQNKTFVVLDRPNPLNGIAIEGNLLEPEFSSFVGLYSIPVRHGLTVGELAKLINGESWLANEVRADLRIIPMKYWKRDLWYDETSLVFRKTSPNMPDLETATVYPGICLLEGTNISAGRGTNSPFKIFGAPWIDDIQLSKKLNKMNLPGVTFYDTTYTPVPIPGVAENPKFNKRECSGIRIKVTNRNQFNSYVTGIYVVKTIHDLFPNNFEFRQSHFDRLSGTDKIRETILNGDNLDGLISDWQRQIKEFRKLREPYLIYD